MTVRLSEREVEELLESMGQEAWALNTPWSCSEIPQEIMIRKVIPAIIYFYCIELLSLLNSFWRQAVTRFPVIEPGLLVSLQAASHGAANPRGLVAAQ